MNIAIGPEAKNGMISVSVGFYEEDRPLVLSGNINVWVPANIDSREEMYRAARKEALAFMERALAAHAE